MLVRTRKELRPLPGARELGHTIQGLRLDTARAWFLRDTPGWDGEPFEAWRGTSLSAWWRTLIMGGSQTTLDWLGPWFDLGRIRRERHRWVTFWIRECATQRLPREWLHWAMSEVQALRKVTAAGVASGTLRGARHTAASLMAHLGIPMVCGRGLVGTESTVDHAALADNNVGGTLDASNRLEALLTEASTATVTPIEGSSLDPQLSSGSAACSTTFAQVALGMIRPSKAVVNQKSA